MRLNCRGLRAGWSRGRVAFFALLIASIGVLGIWLAGRVSVSRGSAALAAGASLPIPTPDSRDLMRVAYSRMPLVFESNQGQTDSRVKFLARGAGYGLFLTANEAVLELQHSTVSTQHSAVGAQHLTRSVIRMTLADANSAHQVIGLDRLPGKSNYIIGNNPAQWHSNIPQFGRVRYPDIYPGIDLVYYGEQGNLEYDFQVAAGADPRQIVLNFQGPDRVSLDPNGDLVLATAGDSVRLHAPRVYQTAGAEQRSISARFAILAENRVGLEIGDYDRSRALFIDPVLT